MIKEFGIKRENEERRDGGCAIVYDPHEKKFAVARQHDGVFRIYSGGLEANEDVQEGTLRELKEESGLYDFARVEYLTEALTHYYNSLRKVNRVAHATCFLVIVNSRKTQSVQLEAHETFTLEWATAEDILDNWRKHNQNHDFDHWMYFFECAQGKIKELGL